MNTCKSITLRWLSFLFFIGFLSAAIWAQENIFNWQCGTPDSEVVFNGPIGTQTIDVVFVFLDFPDGRINGVIPTTDEQLNEVSNIDAVLNMGYVTTNGGTNYTKKVRKYIYDDFWNMYFSSNTFLGSAHPDWESHGQYNNPPGDDPAKGYGSFKEYYSEASYGKLTINAPETHPGGETGIVNNIIYENGRKIILPIMLDNLKSLHSAFTAFTNEPKASSIICFCVSK